MKSKCGMRNSACGSAQAIYTDCNRPPALLLAIPAGAHFTFPLTSRRALLALSSLSISAGWTDAQESWQRRIKLMRQPCHRRPPHHHHHSLAPLSSSVILPLPLSSFYLFWPLIYPLPLLLSLISRAPAFSCCITHGLAAGRAAVLEAAWGLRSHLVISGAKLSFWKAS